MPTIGPYTVLTFGARLLRATQKIALIETAPGVDGVGVVKGGWTTKPQKMPTVTETTSAALAEALAEKYRALHGEVVTVVDQFGVTYPNVTIMGVVAVKGSAGYSSKWRVEAEWTLLVDTARPSAF
ncbi:MAG: hypothetical protein V4537_18090 [Pseudomonadota bacterium]